MSRHHSYHSHLTNLQFPYSRHVLPLPVRWQGHRPRRRSARHRPRDRPPLCLAKAKAAIQDAHPQASAPGRALTTQRASVDRRDDRSRLRVSVQCVAHGKQVRRSRADEKSGQGGGGEGGEGSKTAAPECGMPLRCLYLHSEYFIRVNPKVVAKGSTPYRSRYSRSRIIMDLERTLRALLLSVLGSRIWLLFAPELRLS